MTVLIPNYAAKRLQAAPFQIEDAAFAVSRRRVVLGHKTGLGKTFISLLAWSQLPDINRVVIIGSLSSIGTWTRQLGEWGASKIYVMQGSGDPDWEKLTRGESGIWLCTYATARMFLTTRTKKIRIDLLICDELHRAMRNRTATYKSIKNLEARNFLGLTATWASKGPQDLWPVLNIIDHTEFSSYWRYVDRWCHTSDGAFGKQIIGVKDAPKLKALLAAKYYRTRTWKEVGKQFLPKGLENEPIIRRSEIVLMSPQQFRAYTGMASKMEASIGRDVVLAQNSLDRLTKCLQLAVSPQLLFPSAEPGAPVQWLVERLLTLNEAVVFVPFKGLTQIVANALFAEGYERSLYFLTGGNSADVTDATIAEWKQNRGHLICTISFAQSFALDVADNAFFLGFDWDPNNNIQAEGRMRRFDSSFDVPCLCTYIVPQYTVYEQVKDVINGKVDTVRQVLAEFGV